MILLHRDKKVLVIAIDEDTAKGIVEKVEYMYTELPP